MNQHTMIGIAVYVPMVTRNNAAYWTGKSFCMEIRMENPVIERQIQNTAKPKR